LSFHLVADLVERHTVQKAVGDSVGVFVFYEGAEGGEVTDEVSDYYASVFGFGGSDAECYVRGGNWIAGRDD
jgi:Uri superfamily endonuclease